MKKVQLPGTLTFSDRVVKVARSIPPGRVTTYGRIARAAGGGGLSAQSVTRVLAKAYNNGITDIPFHRIVYANGKVWMSNEYRAKRMRLYKQEGIKIDKKDKITDFDEIVVEFH